MYLHVWSSFEEMCKDFSEYDYTNDKHIDSPDVKPEEILLASYGQGSYEGDAFVLYQRGGKLYEVNASHCSCYGLEGQWKPEETTKEALLHRIENGSLGSLSYDDYNNFKNELIQVLNQL